MMLEWAAEQATEITTTAIDLEFLPTDTNEDRGVQNLEFVLQQTHTALMALTSYEANDIVANSRKNPLEAWRRLQKRYDPTTGRKEAKPSAHDPFSWTVLSSGTPSGDRTLGVPRVSLRDEAEDEIKLAGLEALPEAFDTRTLEDARLEIVTHVEAKFGLTTLDSKPSSTGSRGHPDPMDVDAVNSHSSSKGKGSSTPRDGCFKCGGAQFQRDSNARKGNGKQSSGKGKQSKSWSKGDGKGKRKESKGTFKRKSKGAEGAKGSYKGKTLKNWFIQD